MSQPILPNVSERLSDWPWWPTIGVGLSVLGIYVVWLQPLSLLAGDKTIGLSALLGATIGMIEVAKRYRDEPLKAVLSPWGMIYMIINALFGVVALYFIYHFRNVFGALADNRLLAAFAAGVGAAGVLRTRISIFKSPDGQDVALPLDYLISELLAQANKQIDRHRAKSRRDLVERCMGDIRALGPFKEAADYLLSSLLAFQSDQEKQKSELNTTIDSYEKLALPEDIKYLALGFVFLSLVGERHFEQVVKNAGKLRVEKSLRR